MKTVHFDESANQGIGYKNPLFAKRRGRGTRRRGNMMMTPQDLELYDVGNHREVYELIKDTSRHNEIKEVCKEDPSVEALLVAIINKLSGEAHFVRNAELGLTNIIADRVDKGELPDFEDLHKDINGLLRHLFGIKKFAALLNSSEISSHDSMVTVDLHGVAPTDEETVTRIVFRAAFREAKAHGASLGEFKEACTKIFKQGPDTYYESALKFVTKDAEASLSTQGSQEQDEVNGPLGIVWFDKVIDEFVNGGLSLSNVPQQANDDVASFDSNQTYYLKMKTVALSTLIWWCTKTGKQGDVDGLNPKIFLAVRK